MQRFTGQDLTEIINMSWQSTKQETINKVQEFVRTEFNTELHNVDLNFVIDYVRKYGKENSQE